MLAFSTDSPIKNAELVRISQSLNLDSSTKSLASNYFDSAWKQESLKVKHYNQAEVPDRVSSLPCWSFGLHCLQDCGDPNHKWRTEAWIRHLIVNSHQGNI